MWIREGIPVRLITITFVALVQIKTKSFNPTI